MLRRFGARDDGRPWIECESRGPPDMDADSSHGIGDRAGGPARMGRKKKCAKPPYTACRGLACPARCPSAGPRVSVPALRELGRCGLRPLQQIEFEQTCSLACSSDARSLHPDQQRIILLGSQQSFEYELMRESLMLQFLEAKPPALHGATGHFTKEAAKMGRKEKESRAQGSWKQGADCRT